MEIAIKDIIERRVVIAPRDRIDAFSAPELRSEIERLLLDGATHFVLDLSDVSFLDSSGLAVLVSLLKRARQTGGDVKLVMPREDTAQRILKLTKFDRVFDVAASVDAALAAF